MWRGWETLAPTSNHRPNISRLEGIRVIAFMGLQAASLVNCLYNVSFNFCLFFEPKPSWAGNQGKHKNFDPSLLPKNLWLLFMGFSNFFFVWKKNSNMANSKKLHFSKPSFPNIFSWNCARLVIGSVGLIDEKGINVAQPIWLSGCPS